jgi:hypothetical protein
MPFLRQFKRRRRCILEFPNIEAKVNMGKTVESYSIALEEEIPYLDHILDPGGRLCAHTRR